MAAIWITYAWKDNENKDVDFVAQELEQAGAKVKLDRWELRAGQRLWDQIAKFIQDPAESDAWMMYVTANSLGSEPCKEEFAYALDRALDTRGGSFPVIGLFPGSVDKSLIPAGIKTRLYVSLRDPDWKERILAAAENRSLDLTRPQLQPFLLKLHQHGSHLIFEVRPRAGTWCPFVAGVPVLEKELVKAHLSHGPAGWRPAGGGPRSSILHMPLGLPEQDTQWAYVYGDNEATPTMSYYVQCEAPPSKLLFGVRDGQIYIMTNPVGYKE